MKTSTPPKFTKASVKPSFPLLRCPGSRARNQSETLCYFRSLSLCTNNSGAEPARLNRGLKAPGGTLEVRSPNSGPCPRFNRLSFKCRLCLVLTDFRWLLLFPACRPGRCACYTFNPSSDGFLPADMGVCWQSIRAPRPAICVLRCFHQLEGDLSQNGISGK